MHDYSFYSAIIGLSSNWRILDATMDESSGDIELHISSQKGSRFSCPSCGAEKLPFGVSKARWLHENHLKIRFFITALIPIINCDRCGEMKVNIPWKQAGQATEELQAEPVEQDEGKGKGDPLKFAESV
jgi:predicted RNA-binding Zn-ribbon protein involved in translation (DUF1610 family)